MKTPSNTRRHHHTWSHNPDGASHVCAFPEYIGLRDFKKAQCMFLYQRVRRLCLWRHCYSWDGWDDCRHPSWRTRVSTVRSHVWPIQDHQTTFSWCWFYTWSDSPKTPNYGVYALNLSHQKSVCVCVCVYRFAHLGQNQHKVERHQDNKKSECIINLWVTHTHTHTLSAGVCFLCLRNTCSCFTLDCH